MNDTNCPSPRGTGGGSDVMEVGVVRWVWWFQSRLGPRKKKWDGWLIDSDGDGDSDGCWLVAMGW